MKTLTLNLQQRFYQQGVGGLKTNISISFLNDL